MAADSHRTAAGAPVKAYHGLPNVIAIPREDLRTVQGRRGLLFGSLTLETGTDTYSFSNVLKKSLPGFLEELQSSAQ